MVLPFSPKQGLISRKCFSLLLASSWINGLIFGMVLFFMADSSLMLWMRRLPWMSVSIVNLFLVAIIPTFVSIAAVHLRVIYLLYPVCFLKALQFSFVSCGIAYYYGDAGWLMRFSLLFQDILTLPFLYDYWQRHLCKRRDASILSSSLLLSATFLISSMEIHIISPFWASLIGASR